MAKGTERPGKVVPYPLSMVICDAIWTDPGTRKHTLLGTFSEISCLRFPARHGNLGVYVECTGIRGAIPVMIRGIDAEESREPVFMMQGRLNVSDPVEVAQVAFNLQNLVFAEPGEYRVQFYASDEFIMERRILVKQFDPTAAQGMSE